MNIDGNNSYKIFPTPRILAEDIKLNFDESNKRKIKVKKLYILIFLCLLSEYFQHD